MARNPDSTLYNKIHETYDNIEFAKKPCERLVAHARVGKGERVLDVACGTGWATLDAALAVGQTGRVVGIDIADKALEIARSKADQEGLDNIRFEQQDGHRLKFEDCAFDVVICASALFYFDDIPSVLREWRRVLRPGGRAAFSSFGPEFRTVSIMLRKTIAKYDKGSSPTNRNEGWLDTIDKCVRQLADTGFDITLTATEELGYYYPDLDAYWEEVMSSMRRILIDRLNLATADRVRREHLEEMKAFAGDQGIWRPVPTIFAVGLKTN